MAQALDWFTLEQSSPLLAAMPLRARRAVRLRKVLRADHVFNRGDRPRSMYFVLSGEVHLVRQSLTGCEVILQRARHGFLAEASLDQTAYHCDAVAVLPASLLMLPRKLFSEALDNESFRNRWIAHLARELRRVRAQSERMSLKTAWERIIHYVETEGDGVTITLGRSKKDWAAELGLTHEALYRALARMEHAGQIAIDGRSIVLRRRTGD